LVWSTYFGQNYAAQTEALAIDSQGNVYLTGYTSGGLPVTAGALQPAPGGSGDAFVAEFSNTAPL
jgi:hypothetical protein